MSSKTSDFVPRYENVPHCVTPQNQHYHWLCQQQIVTWHCLTVFQITGIVLLENWSHENLVPTEVMICSGWSRKGGGFISVANIMCVWHLPRLQGFRLHFKYSMEKGMLPDPLAWHAFGWFFHMSLIETFSKMVWVTLFSLSFGIKLVHF